MAFDARWKAGDVVSSGMPPEQVIGRVMVFNRQFDGRPYLRVEVRLPSGATTWKWPDGWFLGSGHLQQFCRDCGQEYRTSDVTEVLCPACDREIVLSHHADEIPAGPVHARLHGRGRRHVG